VIVEPGVIIDEPILEEPILEEPIAIVENGAELTVPMADLPEVAGRSILEIGERAMLVEVIGWGEGVVVLQLPQLLMVDALDARLYIGDEEGNILLAAPIRIIPLQEGN